MERKRNSQAPAWYVIRIKNTIDPAWGTWFEGMEILPAGDGDTLLVGELVDQSALYGLLEKIHSLNLGLVSVQEIDPGDDQAQINQRDQNKSNQIQQRKD